MGWASPFFPGERIAILKARDCSSHTNLHIGMIVGNEGGLLVFPISSCVGGMT
jgi:hypothetical protein